MPTYRDRPGTVAADLRGVDLAGRPAEVRVLGTGCWTLLLFLSSGCQGCAAMWEATADPAGHGLGGADRVVAVTRDPGEDDPGALAAVAPPGAPVVMSTAAWAAYRVQGAPFFALVDGTGPVAPGDGPGGPALVATEGVAWALEQVDRDVRRARTGP